ncbi:hypothetical protein D3C87_1725090 [compost metagenome]
MIIKIAQCVVGGVDHRSGGDGCSRHLIELSAILFQGPAFIVRIGTRLAGKGFKPGVGPVGDSRTEPRGFRLLEGFDTDQPGVFVDGNQQNDGSCVTRSLAAQQYGIGFSGLCRSKAGQQGAVAQRGVFER